MAIHLYVENRTLSILLLFHLFSFHQKGISGSSSSSSTGLDLAEELALPTPLLEADLVSVVVLEPLELLELLPPR